MNLKGKFMKKCLKHFPYEFKKLTNFYLNRTFYLTFTISVQSRRKTSDTELRRATEKVQEFLDN